MQKNLTNVGAIRKFFSEGDAGREVTIQVLKNLNPTECAELGELCRKSLQESSFKQVVGFIEIFFLTDDNNSVNSIYRIVVMFLTNNALAENGSSYWEVGHIL